MIYDKISLGSTARNSQIAFSGVVWNISLTLPFIMSKNVQTYFKNLAVWIPQDFWSMFSHFSTLYIKRSCKSWSCDYKFFVLFLIILIFFFLPVKNNFAWELLRINLAVTGSTADIHDKITLLRYKYFYFVYSNNYIVNWYVL